MSNNTALKTMPRIADLSSWNGNSHAGVNFISEQLLSQIKPSWPLCLHLLDRQVPDYKGDIPRLPEYYTDETALTAVRNVRLPVIDMIPGVILNVSALRE